MISTTKSVLILGGTLAVIFGLFTVVCIASASSADDLQPASSASQPAAVITYDDELVVNNTGRFDSVYIGKQDVGGVTFFNGTIINTTTDDGADNPVTFGDDVRIDGGIYRGPSKGTSDDMPLKIYDTMIPGLNNINDIGTSSLKWKDLYLAGTLTATDLQGAGIVDSDNIADGTITGDDVKSDTTLTLGGVNWNTPRTDYLSIFGPACSGEGVTLSDGVVYCNSAGDGGGGTANMGATWQANLPNGVTVSSFSGILARSATATENLSCTLYRIPLNTTMAGLSFMATLSSQGINAGNTGQVTDNSVADATVDNNGYSYGITCASSAAVSSGDLGVSGFYVSYTKSSAD